MVTNDMLVVSASDFRVRLTEYYRIAQRRPVFVQSGNSMVGVFLNVDDYKTLLEAAR